MKSRFSEGLFLTMGCIAILGAGMFLLLSLHAAFFSHVAKATQPIANTMEVRK